MTQSKDTAGSAEQKRDARAMSETDESVPIERDRTAAAPRAPLADTPPIAERIAPRRFASQPHDDWRRIGQWRPRRRGCAVALDRNRFVSLTHRSGVALLLGAPRRVLRLRHVHVNAKEVSPLIHSRYLPNPAD